VPPAEPEIHETFTGDLFDWLDQASCSTSNISSERTRFTGQEGGMSMLDLAVMGFYSFVSFIAIGLIVLLAANRH
jgi:hypothetical protein